MRLSSLCRLSLFTPVVVGLTLGLSHPAAAAGYDASADFDVSHDPSQINGGAYRYGYETTLGSAFNIFTFSYTNGTIQGWTTGSSFPFVGKNTGGSTFIVPPGELLLHPDNSGGYSIVRFVAPDTGTYSLSAQFDGLDNATTDVHVLRNDVSLFDHYINLFGDGNTASYSNAALGLSAGDRIDFAVGYGNGAYFSDSTGFLGALTETSSATPEPGACGWILALSLIAIPLLSSRRRKYTVKSYSA